LAAATDFSGLAQFEWRANHPNHGWAEHLRSFRASGRFFPERGWRITRALGVPTVESTGNSAGN
jgi:hypothetical protein